LQIDKHDKLGRNIKEKHLCRDEDPKRVYYMSMEFLMGRSLTNSLNNIGVVDEVRTPHPLPSPGDKHRSPPFASFLGGLCSYAYQLSEVICRYDNSQCIVLHGVRVQYLLKAKDSKCMLMGCWCPSVGPYTGKMA